MNQASEGEEKLGLHAAWAMAVGGMIGGGIFATLGVVIALAGSLAWVSFLIGGLIALATGYSYARLTVSYDRSGGAYTFLKQAGHNASARIVAWILILGYILTVSVYAYTFGAYLGFAIGGPGWLPGASAAAAIIVLTGVNLLGVGEASGVEIFAVWIKLAVLVALAALGIWHWAPEQLALSGIAPGWSGALVGAASVFIAYEGFQLLAYDYEDMRDRKVLIGRAMPVAIVTATIVYIVVALGTAMLVGADQVVAQKEVSLAMAGRVALGQTGFVAVTIAAAFSTASAINATLFATARLSRDVAEQGDLPAIFTRTDREGIPYVGILIIAALALVLAVVGGLASLVQSASIVFLAVFGIVNAIAWRRQAGPQWVAGAGALGSALALVTLAAHFAGLV
ncbi:amino acid permease [Sphingorhabdus soli]|uniref:Amino acid permease n=1 Tax=Flavisphingopyxis soli TaxID=2601267 RepID=A0A5C6UAP4_9SPHN|nr:APC family permease [Sphingorhabdus soli]TXC69036.1 amino acid permease [Sphingorhabdus soli]